MEQMLRFQLQGHDGWLVKQIEWCPSSLRLDRVDS